ncbi:hypothetical protein ACQY0O_006661 [Thecaphora frezii]
MQEAGTAAGSSDGVYERVTQACPARPTQLRTLLDLVGPPQQPLPPSILLHDACSPSWTASYAKTALRALAEQLDPALHAIAVSPLTSNSPSALFRDALQPIENRVGAAASASSSRRPDGSLEWFLWRLSSILEANPQHRVVVLVENAERIRDIWPETVWTSFCRLGELTASYGRITTIFVSSLPWSSYRTPSGLTTAHSPIVIRFPRHTKEEVLEILARDFDSLRAAYHRSVHNTQIRANTALGLARLGINRILKRRDSGKQVDDDSLRKLYANYLGLFYDSVCSHLRDVAQMRVLSAAVWHAYVVPVQAGEATVTDYPLLLLASSHLFRDALLRLQTREIGPKEWTEEVRNQSIKACEERLQAAAYKTKQELNAGQAQSVAQEESAVPTNEGEQDEEEDHVSVDEETRIDHEEQRDRDAEEIKRRRLTRQLANTSTFASLPLIPTFLVLASFLASYNPSRLDVRYFLRDSSLVGQSAASSSKTTGGRKFGPGRGKRTARRGRPAKDAIRITNEEGQTENLNRQELLGPKPFPVDRLLSIFQALITECGPELNAQLALSITPDEVDERGWEQEPDIGDMWEQRARSVGVYSQITNLVARRMLIRTSAPDKLGSTINFRTNVSYNVAATLARKVRFDLDEWLWDWGGGGANAA